MFLSDEDSYYLKFKCATFPAMSSGKREESTCIAQFPYNPRLKKIITK